MEDKELEILRQRAESDDAEAMWELVTYYMEHPETQKTMYEDVEWMQRAAELGHPDAMLHWGGYCQEHLDEPKAAEWFKKSLDAGNTAAAYYLGCYCKEGRGGLPTDLEQAEKYFRQSAEDGYSDAAYEIYVCRKARVDSGECEDMDDALDWLISSAKNGGYAPAQYEVGRLLCDDGIEYLLLAAEQGHEQAQRDIVAFYFWWGVIPETEQGDRNYSIPHICASKEGLKRIKESAKNKLPFAFALLADYYSKTGDYTAAVKYLKRGVKTDSEVGICTWLYGNFFENNYGELFPWDEESPDRCSRQSWASVFYAYSVMSGCKAALDDLIRCFLNEQGEVFTTDAREEVEVQYASESMLLRYRDCVKQYFYVLPDLL